MPSSREINKQNEALNEQRDLMEEISELLDSAAGQADDLGKSLSGVADLFSKIKDDSADTTDNTQENNDNLNTTESILKKVQNQTKKLGASLVSAGKQVASTMTSAFGEIGDILQNVLSLSVVGTFAGIFGAIIGKFQYDFKQVVNEIGLGFEAVNEGANRGFEELLDKADRIGISAKEIVSSSRQLADNFGMGMMATKQLSFDIADGAKALGVQSTTMATLVGQFQLIGDLTAKQSHELSEHVGILAAQNDVAPQAVLEDMAQSTEDMALFSKGGVKNFAKTAIEARKLGMSVKDVANSLKGMLDFESSLNSELEASVMLGKNINFNEARRLAFAGDTAGAFQAIASELGDVDLGSLDPLTLQSVAKAAGMSTEQLLKMSKGADEMGGVDMGEEAMTAQERAALQAERTLTKMEKMLKNLNRDLTNLANEIGGPLIDALTKIGDWFSKFLNPETRDQALQDLYDAFLNFDWLGLGMKIGNFLLDGMVIALTAAAGIIGGIFKGIGDTVVGDFLKTTGVLQFALPKQFDNIAKKLNKIFRGIKLSYLKNVVRPIRSALRPFRMFFKEVSGAKGFKALTKAANMFSKAIKAITTPLRMVLKPFTGIFKVASGILKPFTGFVKLFGKLGLRGIPVIGQILSLFDGLTGGFNRIKEGAGLVENTFRFLGGFLEGVVDGIIKSLTGIVDWLFGTSLTEGYENIKQSLIDTFSGIGESIVEFFKAIPDNIVALFNNVGQLIGDTISAGIALVGNLGQMVADLFLGVGDLIGNMFSFGAEFFSDMFTTAIEGVKKVPGMIADAFMGIGSLVAEKVSGAFDSIGEMFSSIGQTLMNLLPDIDFGEFAGDFADSVKNALSTVTDFIKKPFNLIIRTFNKVKNAISGKVLFKGYTLMTKGFIADNSVFGTIPPKDIGIPKITTPKLFGDVPELQQGGTVEKTGIAKVDKGEVVSGVKGEALKPVADEIGKLKQDMMETNRLLARILSEGIPVVKGV